jgi:actin-related protein 5
VERIRAPELLFQPTLAGIDQAGLAEAIAVALQRAPADAHARLRAGPLLLTGGGAALAGLAARLQAELVTMGEPGKAMQGAVICAVRFRC